ncbi:hypothetical protein BLJAPNOD_05299 [Ensifer sp. M14]|uniref:Uncharacterized protein n=2 Tax=Rhizobiaceae TaxID=82115 RepID=A0A142BPT8_9HYPH|nr:hypothetical protein pSinB_237 [Sinorhizobium sp. M14]RDL48072.1 hypothetical protein BLJAPNOD_05299 [Ensifer sp. M14]
MTDPLPDGRYCSVADVRRVLSELMPHLVPYWERPLKDYAAAAFDAGEFHAGCSVRHHAMTLLCRCIERTALRSGFGVGEARSAGNQMWRSPTLQTGPHCLLLIEPDAFYTHVFSLLGLKVQQREWYITYHASTVSFAEKAKKGPGWLWLAGEPLNVFGLPRSRMDSFSIRGSNGPIRFALSNSRGEPTQNSFAADLLAALPSDEFETAADAIRQANQMLWRRNLPFSVNLLQLDDFDIADLVADHLDDAGSWFSTAFIGNAALAESFLNAIDQFNAGSWLGWIRRTTDFFWGMERGRIVPLRLQGKVLRASNSSNFEIAYRRESIAGALRQRELVPSLYTVFLVTSILPGVRVLGGCRQVIYYPLMRYLAALGFAQSGQSGLLAELRRDARPGLWGHRVLKPARGDPLAEIRDSGRVETLLSRYAEMPLVQAVGDLASFTMDPAWARLSEQMDGGFISAGSPEWQWSRS